MPGRLARRPADPRCLARRAPVPCRARALPCIYVCMYICVRVYMRVYMFVTCRLQQHHDRGPVPHEQGRPGHCAVGEQAQGRALRLVRRRPMQPLQQQLRPVRALLTRPCKGAAAGAWGFRSRGAAAGAWASRSRGSAVCRRPGRLISRRRAGIHWAPRDEFRPPAPGGSQCGALI